MTTRAEDSDLLTEEERRDVRFFRSYCDHLNGRSFYLGGSREAFAAFDRVVGVAEYLKKAWDLAACDITRMSEYRIDAELRACQLEAQLGEERRARDGLDVLLDQAWRAFWEGASAVAPDGTEFRSLHHAIRWYIRSTNKCIEAHQKGEAEERKLREETEGRAQDLEHAIYEEHEGRCWTHRCSINTEAPSVQTEEWIEVYEDACATCLVVEARKDSGE